MKKVIRLTERDLTRLVRRVIREEKESLVDDYIKTMEAIVDYYSYEEYDHIVEELSSLVNAAENDNKLSEEDIDNIYDYYDSIVDDMNQYSN